MVTSWRRSEWATRAVPSARPGTSVGCVSTRVVPPSTRHARPSPRVVASTTAVRDACRTVAFSVSVAPSFGSGAVSGVSGIGASGSKSTNASDKRSPPTPSVIVWWIFCSSATRPSGSPSMIVNSQSGRARSSGCSERDGAEIEQRAFRVARRRATRPGGCARSGRASGHRRRRAARCAVARSRRAGAAGGSRRPRAPRCAGRDRRPVSPRGSSGCRSRNEARGPSRPPT